MLSWILLFIVALAVLLIASDWFVDSAEKIGLSFGISPFIIGVTIVAFGTSLPELATSIVSVVNGMSEIVVSNVVGSNITNILLVLGLTAVIGKCINLDFDVMDIDMPLLFGSAFFLYFVLSDLTMSILEAVLFLIALAVFLINSFGGDRSEEDERPKASAKNYLLLVVGGVLVYFGASYTILAIDNISKLAGIDPDVIAITVVALGTSLPEVVVSIMASRKGKHAIAVGNVLGSNIFNTYAVMGISAFFGDLVIPESIIQFSLPFMIAATILFGMICLSRRISRWEGVMLVIFYGYFIFEMYQRSQLT